MDDVCITHNFAAGPEQVFDAWLDPAIARRFLFATREGEMICAEIDPRVGGAFTLVDRRADMGDVLHAGEYLEIDRPRRLAFTFAVPRFSPDAAMILVEIAPTPGGGSHVTLTQAHVAAEWAERSKASWTKILEWLEVALTQ